MLHIRMLSGEEVASIPVEELCDVRSLKRQLNQLKGFPPRFRQRLFGCGSRGSPLDDDTKLDSPMDLELVLLTYSVASPADADELVNAARDGSVAEVDAILQLPTIPDVVDRHGRSPLMASATRNLSSPMVELLEVRNHIEVVRLLLEANANTETRDPDGCTALFAACQNGHVEVAQVLLEGGADKNSRSFDGFTCLMMASQGGHVEIARLLVAAGAEKNVQKHGATALWAASQNGHVEVARLLLEAGADKNLSSSSCNCDPCVFFWMNLTSTDMGFTCLMMAAQEGHVEFVRLLLETNADKDYVDFANQSGITALVMASRQGHVEVVRLLLAAGADKNLIMSDGFTSLMVAAQEGRAEVVRLLVAERAELNIANNVGVTSLMIASHRGHVEATRLLLQAGAEKDLKDMDGITALMKASLEGHNECVQLLLAAGADTDIAEKDGFTSLMIASQEDRVEAVRLLLNASADTSLTNRERNSDLHEIPIFYNSPMATKCLRIFETYTNMCSVSVQEQANRCNNPWVLKYIQNMPDRHSFAAAEAEIGACVVLAAPGMLQSGASRELFESWAPDKKNGVIVTGYSVPGTLAHELKSDPETVTLNDGRKVNVRATVKFMSFSAHSDYNQTSEFIRQLKANVVVLVHGEEHEMGRMRNKLRELRHRCGEHPLAALRWASCLLHVSRSALVATLALEVLDDAVARTWMLTPQERQELKAQVEPMLSESAWRPRCGAVLRALGEQEHIARHSQSACLPRCKSLPNVEVDPKPSCQSPVSATQKLRSPTRQEHFLVYCGARIPSSRCPPEVSSVLRLLTDIDMEIRAGTASPLSPPEYPDLNVTAPQNCQTVALRVPADRSTDSVGAIVEDMAVGLKKGRTEVSGLLVEDTTGVRTLLRPEDLGTFTALAACKVEQCQRFQFPHSLSALGRALLELYDEVDVADGCLQVCSCVRVALESQVLCITWESSPISDMVADSVSLTAMELTRSPSMLTALKGTDVQQEEQRVFQVLCTYLQQEFGRLTVDDKTQVVAFEVDGNQVSVNFPMRAVECKEEALKQRVRTALRRCERALRPVPVF
eukprot:s2957_g1.t3